MRTPHLDPVWTSDVDLLDLVLYPTDAPIQGTAAAESNGGILSSRLGASPEPPQHVQPLDRATGKKTRHLALQSGENSKCPSHAGGVFDQLSPMKSLTSRARAESFQVKMMAPIRNLSQDFCHGRTKANIKPESRRSLIHLLKPKYPPIDNTFANYQRLS